jgi:GT2 family glycosyltransferase/glycosyltransferase involved in cell wall biosynthesis/SAM-dependent methyltransferase
MSSISHDEGRPVRVAILSFLFNWPSTGGGIVHTVELADFLGRAGYDVRHIYARRLPWGIGRVTQAVPFDSRPLDFDESAFQAAEIQSRFRQAVEEFDPDYVIITDSWNFKPLLAEAVRGFRYFLRLQASECLCPLNNLRFLPTGEQCPNHQLADAERCRRCVSRWAGNSGGLHEAERALVGFGTPKYNETLRRAFAEAEAVLVVNELAATMIGPYAKSVRVVTSGFDPERFVWGENDAPPQEPAGRKLRLFMAGLVEDRIKGFHVLDAACQQLWRTRQDFELLATGEPAGQVNHYTRFVGWLSQDELPAQMRDADIIVVPTVAQDALGRTAVEAMAAGRPVVASRLGGLPYTVADGAGLLFEPGSAEDLAQKLALLLDDRPLRRTMGQLGRRRFEQHFTWQAIIDRHYRPLLAARRNAKERNGTESVPYRGGRIDVVSEFPDRHGGRFLQASSTDRIRRIALVYDDELRPETTGVYCRRALEKLAAVRFFRPNQLDCISPGEFDLILNIDDGLRYRLPERLRPAAWWCIDTHIDFDWSLKKAADFDFVFAAQRDGAARLKENGVASALWLPLACDAEIHGRQADPHPKGEGEKEFDVCFVGNVAAGARADLVRLIQQVFPRSYVGQAYFEEMARIYSASRTVFNRSVKNDVNMRVFEALASGSLLLTNDLSDNGQAELFRDGIHLATYRDAHELLDKLRFYLRRDELRERIAAAGRAEALAKHTYRHRMEEILRVTGDCKLKIVNCKLEIESGEPRSVDRSYFEFARPELLALVPSSAASVLEIGCGAGRLGEALKARQPCHVTGIELDGLAAESARQRLDDVVVGDVETLDLAFASNSFDAIVCGDVLEHLRQPERLLRRIHNWLKPGGKLIASIPNVAHRSVIGNLLCGNWDYEPAGLLDATHLRFFTRRSIERLLYRAHFAVRSWQVVGGAGYDDWCGAGHPGEVEIGPVQARGLSRQQAEELHAYQYLIGAEAAAVPDYGLTSIVILTHNQWQYTRRCLESIRFRTDEPYELIVVDNGSTDGSPERLRDMPDVTLIANRENRGFPAGVNQGIAAARGRQVLLLNNDVVVTTGWLRRMLEAMGKAEGRRQKAEGNPKSKIENPESRVGLVGPLTNHASGHQEIAPGYTDLDSLDGFAWEHGKQHAGHTQNVDRLIGFCLLIRREVIDEIGLLDERFGIGNYEDDDYCRRARDAGWWLAVAQDAYIHHFGHRSFAGAGVDLHALLIQNRQLFDDKWTARGSPKSKVESPKSGEDPAASVGNGLRAVPEEDGLPSPSRNKRDGLGRPSSGDCGDAALPSPPSFLISLCMIVRDNAGTIRAVTVHGPA